MRWKYAASRLVGCFVPFALRVISNVQGGIVERRHGEGAIEACGHGMCAACNHWLSLAAQSASWLRAQSAVGGRLGRSLFRL
jgi:hypothetical protein